MTDITKVPHTLLLADDSVTIQRVIELTFADEDIEVVAVGDGDQAIARLNTAPRPDIVLADIGMPGKTGYEVADYIKHSPELSHIPVVLLTGAFEPVDQAKAEAVECDGVLAKPFEPQLVVGRVKELLARSRVEAGKGRAQPLTPAGVDSATHSTFDIASRAPVAELDEYFDRLDAAFANLSSAGRSAVREESSRVAPPANAEPVRGDAVANAEAASSAEPPPPLTAIQPAAERGLSYASPHADFAAQPTDVAGQPEQAQPAANTATHAAMAQHAETIAAAPHADAAPAQPAEPPVPAPSRDVASAHAQPIGDSSSSASAATLPSLVEAFTALLAAERTSAPPDASPAWPAGALALSAPPTISDDELERIVERVTRQVLDRLSARVVRETVTETVSSIAERLVREEIDRIKQAIK